MGRAFAGSRASFAASTYPLPRRSSGAGTGLILSVFMPLTVNLALTPGSPLTSLSGGGAAVPVQSGNKLIVEASVQLAFAASGSNPATDCFLQLQIDGVTVQSQAVVVPSFAGSSPAGIVVPFTFESAVLGAAGTQVVDILATLNSAGANVTSNPTGANGGILIERVGV